jgi:PKD repeat protein
MYRHNTTVAFPYTASGILSITGSDAGSAYYYYFYEWQVQPQGCSSSRIPIIASIINVGADFTNSISGNIVNFTNTSTGAISYDWDFGDGDTSSQINPSHTYNANGTYSIRLIATNGSCSDTMKRDITISSVGGINDNPFSEVFLYPNPLRENITIDFGSKYVKTLSIHIFNVTGKLVYDNKLQDIAQPIIIKMLSLDNGIYDLVLRNEKTEIHFKIVILK